VRDEFTCQECGARGGQVETHVWRQPRLWPSYRPDDIVSLCPDCHEAAHAWSRAEQVEPAAGVGGGTDDVYLDGRRPR
jgi:5-methylcytosine-specific restriction endonuclease McrA